MSRVLRPAGARKPAPSTSAGSQRPDAHTGRARRLSLLLPVLALLAGAFSLFAPASAQAQGEIWSSTLTVDRLAAGGNSWFGCDNTDANQDSCSTALSEDEFVIDGFGTYRIRYLLIATVSGNTSLVLSTVSTSGVTQDELPASFDANIFLTVDGSSSFAFNDAVRSTGNAGVVTHKWNSPGIQWSDDQQVSVKLTLLPPAAPTNLRVAPFHADSSRLDLTWAAPSGASGYDMHYTSAPPAPCCVPDTAPLLNHPIRNNPAVGWVAVPHTGTETSKRVTLFAPLTTYRVRVRARNSAGVSDWVVGKATTTGTPPITASAPAGTNTVWKATLTVDQIPGQLADGTPVNFFGCDNGDLNQDDCAGASGALTDSEFTYAGNTFTITAFYWRSNGSITIYFGDRNGAAVRNALSALTLDVDGDPIRIESAGATSDNFISFNYYPDTAWTDGRMVSIELYGPDGPGSTVSLSASPNPVQEGSPVTVTATLSAPLSQDVRIPLNTGMVPFNLATVGAYDIAIPSGQTTGTHEFTAPQLEDGEMKQYQIAVDWHRMPKSSPLVPKGSQSTAGVTVLDENADPHRVSVSDASGTEMRHGYPRLCFAFTLDRAASHEIWVGYRTENGTAIAGQDYQGVVGSPVIPFEPGETRKRKCISILDDNVEDSGETFSMVLVNPHGAILGRDRGTGTIYNHEPTSLSSLTAEGASAEEGPFTALDIGTFAPATTAYAATVPHGTTHVRLTPTSLNRYLTITTGLDGKGKTQVPFGGGTGPAVALAVGENVLVVKTLFNGQRQTYRVTVTRQAAPAAVEVTLSATPNPVQEGSPVTVRATLAEALDEEVTIPLRVTRGTSEDGDHGSLASITLPAGFTSSTATVTTVEDSDGDDETFTVSLGSLPAGLTAGSASSVEVTITDSGLQQSTEPLTAAFENVPSEHDGTGFSFDLTLSEAPGAGNLPVAASFKVAPGKASVSGSGRRYTVTVTPKPANAWKDVTITLAGGRACDEAGAVCTADGRALSNTSSVTVGGPVRIRVEGARAREGKDASLDFAVTLNRAASHEVLVDYATADETATAGSDYTATSGTLTFAAGETAKTVSVPVLDDAIHEGREVMRLLLSNPQGAYLRKVHRRARGIITNADPLPSAWQIRFGRSVSQQVVDALQQRFSSTTPSGLQLTLAGEALTSDTPLQENHVLLSRLLGFERVSSQEVVQGSSFNFSPEGAGARLSFWGKGAFSSFNGIEESITLTGDVTTAVVGAEWNTQRWRAGAALSHSWGNGSYQGDRDGGDGRISSSLTGVFPYGRYALTPRLGLWATAGYGWGSLSLNPDGDAPEYNPNTTLALGAVGMDGLLLDGGSEGITLTTTADALFLKTTSEAVAGLESSEGNISRLRLGLEATRPFPLANGASLSPSLEVGLRQDSGDAETGFGMDLGAGLSWNDPEHGITATVKGRTLLSHGAEDFQDQGLALSFSWQPSPSNRGASLSLSHAVGLPAEGGMAALLNPTAIEVLDDANSDGERFEARLAYGFPFYNNRLTLTPAVALALSPSSRSYGLLWSVAPYAQQAQDDPWQLSLEGERQETSSSTVDHSLKLRFALPL